MTYYNTVMVYAGTAGQQDAQLLYIHQPEGLIVKEGDAFTYKYFKTDHLGNTRMVLAAVRSGDSWEMHEEQSTDYYPFGMAWGYENLNNNKYLYSGKELQDAQVGGSMLARWFNPDPANQFANPYLYCANNPAAFIDPDGRSAFSAFAPAFTFGLYGLFQHNQAINQDYSSTEAFFYAGVATAIL